MTADEHTPSAPDRLTSAPRRTPPRIVVGAGVVVALAVVGAVAFVAGLRSDRDTPAPASAQSATGQSATGQGSTTQSTTAPGAAGSAPAQTTAPAASSTATAPAPTENELGVAYLEGRTVHRTDGSVVELPAFRQGYRAAWQIGDDVFATTGNRLGSRQLRQVDSSGARVATYRVSSPVVADAAHTALAWVDPDYRLRVVSDQDVRTLADEISPGEVVPTALSGGAACMTGGDDCRVYTTLSEGESGIAFDADGTQSPLPGEAAVVDDVSADGLATLSLPAGARGPCSTLVELAAPSSPLLLRCDAPLQQISPDGRHVTLLERTGERVTSVDVLRPDESTAGEGIRAIEAGMQAQVASFTPSGGYVTSTAWQDADHLLVAAHVEQGSEVVRLGVDGSEEVVLGPVAEGGESRTAFVLEHLTR